METDIPPTTNGKEFNATVTLRRSTDQTETTPNSFLKPRVMSLNFLPKPYRKPSEYNDEPPVFKSFQAPESPKTEVPPAMNGKPPIAPKPEYLRTRSMET